MHRSALFSGLAIFAVLAESGAQPGPRLTREDGKWVRVFYGNAPAASRLRVNTNGPVTIEGGVSKEFTYTVKVSVAARTAAEAQRVFERYAVKHEQQGQWMVFTAPGGAATPIVTLKGPKLLAVSISTSAGAIEARNIEGSLEVDSGAGELFADKVRGQSRLVTGAGDITVGEVGGNLHCSTGGGRIDVRSVRGPAVLETNGGDIVAVDAGSSVHAETGGGGVRIGTAGGAVTAISGGGEIVVGKAGGIVTLKNMAGPVQVGAAAGVRCESVSGGIRLNQITGPMRVSTSMGSIMASLLAIRGGDSLLATGSGDITVLIPSNVGVTVQAQNQLADSLRRIVSDFREVKIGRQGTRLIAEGPVNGGGPLLQISGMGGTIYLKRQP
jgi:DUF4097 and DUF4098 domain-containing protein YvlB